MFLILLLICFFAHTEPNQFYTSVILSPNWNKKKQVNMCLKYTVTNKGKFTGHIVLLTFF